MALTRSDFKEILLNCDFTTEDNYKFTLDNGIYVEINFYYGIPECTCYIRHFDGKASLQIYGHHQELYDELNELQLLEVATTEMYVTVEVSLEHPRDWTPGDVREVFVSRVNTHIELNPINNGTDDKLKISDVAVRAISPDSPYR